MKLLAAAAIAAVLFAQIDRDTRPPRNEPPTLPNGRNQMEEILKADHEKNVKELAELIRIAEEVQNELMRQDRHVLSLENLKKLERIEKMAKNLRSRIKR